MNPRVTLAARLNRAAFIILLSATGLTCRDGSPTGPSGPPSFAAAKATTVTIAPDTVSIVTTKTKQLVATVRDQNGNPMSGQTVTWFSENTAIATVSSSGLVTAKTVLDSVRIRATSSTKVGYARIRVIRPPVATVTVAPDTTMSVTDTKTMRVTLKDADGVVLTGRTVTWSSDRPTVASVNATTGLVTGLADDGGIGAKITATSEGKTGFATVRIQQRVVRIAPDTTSIVATKTRQLTATVTDLGGNPIPGATVTWGTENASIATVSASGLVTALSLIDSTRITATSKNAVGYSRVRVIPPPVATVVVAPDTSISVGDVKAMRVTLRDADNNILTGRVVSWSSDRPAVATVNASTGVVTGIADDAGTGARITATSEGQSAFATVRVRIRPTTLALANASGTYRTTAVLSATLTSNGSPVSGRMITWSRGGVPLGGNQTNASGVATTTVSLNADTAGTYLAGIGASWAGDAAYTAASSTANLVINKAAQAITFDPIPSHTFGDAPFRVSAFTGTTSPITFTAAGPCSLSAQQDGQSPNNASSTLVTLAGSGSCTVTAAQPGNVNYLAAQSVAQSFAVGQGSQTITFAALPSRTFGDAPFALSATASSGLPVSYAAAGACTVAGGTVSLTSTGSCTITASQGGNGGWQPAADVAQTFAISSASATIVLSGLSHTYDGTPKSAVATITPAGLQTVSVLYDGSATAPTNAGSYAVEATLTNANYSATPAAGTLVIARAPQSIAFDALDGVTRTLGDAPFAIDATASSSLPVSFAASGPCTVSGNSVTMTGAGNCTIVASQSGDANRLAAANVSRSFDIGSAWTTLQVASASGPFGGSATLTATLSSSGTPLAGRTINFTLNHVAAGSAVTDASGVASVVASLAGINAGSYTSGTGANFTGDADHQSAWVSSILTVGQGNASLSISNLSQSYDGSPHAVVVTTNPAGLTGVTVTYDGQPTAPSGAGSYAVVASLDNPNYSAPNAEATLLIAKATAVLAAYPTSGTFGGSVDLAAWLGRSGTALPGRSISFTLNGATVGSAVTGSDGFARLSSVSVAGVDAGAYPTGFGASFDGDADYQAASSATQLVIAKASATLTLDALYQNYDGSARAVSITTAPAGLTGATATYNGSATIPTGAGSYAVVASLDNTNYSAANVSGTLVVRKGTPTFTWTPAPIVYGTALGAGQLNVSAQLNGAPLAGSFVFIPPAGTVLGGGSQQLHAGFRPADEINVESGEGFTTLEVAPAPQTITFAPLPNRGYLPRNFQVEATSSSGQPVLFTASGNCWNQQWNQIWIAADTGGTCTVTANQAGNANWQPAPSVSHTFSILRSVSGVEVTPDPVVTTVGGAVTVSAIVRGGSDGVILTDRVVVWTLLDNGVASMTPSGGTANVTGVASGTARLVASIEDQTDTVLVVVAPSNTTHLWTGRMSSDWDNAANWWHDAGSTPTPTSGIDQVFIPVGYVFAPRLITQATLGKLVVENNATFTIDGTLIAYGDVAINGFLEGAGALSLEGEGHTLAGFAPHLRVNGTTTLSAHLMAMSIELNSRLVLNGHSARAGSVSVKPQGILTLSDARDTLVALGDFEALGYVEQMTGVIMVAGNFLQGDMHRPDSFSPTGGKVVFNGWTSQAISFSRPDLSHFVDLEISNANGQGVRFGPNDIVVRGEVRVDQGATLEGSTLRLRGGKLPVIQGNWFVNSTSIETDVTMTANTSIPADVVIDGARVNLNGHVLWTGSLRVTGSQYGSGPGPVMHSAADTLRIAGNAEFNGFVEQSAGVIEIGGNFLQGDLNRPDSFSPTGGKVVFSGWQSQAISFARPDLSHFVDVEIDNRSGQPVSFGPTSILVRGELVVRQGSTLNGNQLRVRGGKLPVAEGNYFVTTTSIESDVTMTANRSIPADVVIDGARVWLNGHVLWVGSLKVQGQFGSASGPVLYSNADSLRIVGNAEFNGFVEQLAGVIEIGGNFLQGDLNRPDSFSPSGGKVIFNGYQPQAISFSRPDLSHFVDVEIANRASAPVNFGPNFIVVRGEVIVRQNQTLNGNQLRLRGGKLPVIEGNYFVNSTSIESDVTMTANRSIPAEVVIDGARVVLNGHVLWLGSLIVNGSAYGGASGPVLQTASDTLRIAANVLFNGFVEQYGGVIEIGGNFTQGDLNRPDSFSPMGGKVVFKGWGPQSIYFARSDLSAFADVEFVNTNGVTLLTNAHVRGQLVGLGQFLNGTYGPGVLNGGGRRLDVTGGLDVDGLVLDNVDLVVNGGALTRFDNVSFTGYSPSASYQMSIIQAGGSFAMNGITFAGTPDMGNAWIRADQDPYTGGPPFALTVGVTTCGAGYSSGTATVTFQSPPSCGGAPIAGR